MFEKFFMFSHLSHNNTEDAFPITKGLGLFFFSWQNFYAFWDFYIPLYVRSAKLGMFVSYLTWKCLFYGRPMWVSAGFWHFGHILMVSTALYGPKSIFCCRKIGSILQNAGMQEMWFLEPGECYFTVNVHLLLSEWTINHEYLTWL